MESDTPAPTRGGDSTGPFSGKILLLVLAVVLVVAFLWIYRQQHRYARLVESNRELRQQAEQAGKAPGNASELQDRIDEIERLREELARLRLELAELQGKAEGGEREAMPE